MTIKKLGFTDMPAQESETWIDVKDAAPLFGMSVQTIKNAISLGKFPVPTYKLGKRRVFDRQVLAAYFEEQRAQGMRALKEGPPRRGPVRRR
jgi:predicted DNA-binding transcriptional regulator AlpA